MPSDACEVFENTTELGEDRPQAPSPTQEFLADLGNHLDISEHHKPSVFTEASNDLIRYAYDWPHVVGGMTALENLFSALTYKHHHEDDEDQGVLTVPTASIKALAVLTSSSIVRGRLTAITHNLPAIMTLLQLPHATSEVQAEALTTLSNACCSRPLAYVIGNQPCVAETVRSLISHPHPLTVQNRALSLATHLVSSMPVFAKAFAQEGAILAIANTLAAPSSRANFITQNRAALLLAAMSRYPVLNSAITEAARNAPALREAAAAAATKAAAARNAMEDGQRSDEEEGDEGSAKGSTLEAGGTETDLEPTARCRDRFIVQLRTVAQSPSSVLSAAQLIYTMRFARQLLRAAQDVSVPCGNAIPAPKYWEPASKAPSPTIHLVIATGIGLVFAGYYKMAYWSWKKDVNQFYYDYNKVMAEEGPASE